MHLKEKHYAIIAFVIVAAVIFFHAKVSHTSTTAFEVAGTGAEFIAQAWA
jgi:hypothetical protein